jgi:transport and Golgi organization protein 2
MCTVSFIPKSRGFYLSMNRDEKRSRPTASAPEIVRAKYCRAMYPRDVRGGSWIAANEEGVCLALINWHRIEHAPLGKTATRGCIITALAGARSSQEVTAALMRLTLREYRPFRLVAIVPTEHVVTEWGWNLEFLTRREHRWERQHWFSSGFNEAIAESERARLCERAFGNENGVGLESLRRLHSSHMPKRGPFSICMHRSDAVTVSYTEIVASDGCIVMRYKNGAPCSGNSTSEISLPAHV